MTEWTAHAEELTENEHRVVATECKECGRDRLLLHLTCGRTRHVASTK